jgi:hypothetical protein
MTLIATFNASSIPILFGDLLITSLETKDPLFIPGIGSVHGIFPEGSGCVPTDLRQKVCLINDCLAVAWAGYKIKANSVLKDLSELSRPITIDLIKNYFDTVPEEDDVKFIGLFFDEETGKLNRLSHGLNMLHKKTHRFGEVIADGSGLEHLQQNLALMEKAKFTIVNPASPNWFEKMVNELITLTSIFLAQGMNLKNMKLEGSPPINTILNYFGGGYEMVYPMGGKLKKLENICYVFWVVYCISSQDVHVRQEWKMFYYSYSGDLLLLRALYLRPTIESKLEEFHAEENTTYVIPPIHKIYKKEEVLQLIKN